MFRELRGFVCRRVLWKSLIKDGELWTAVAVGLSSYWYLKHNPVVLLGIKRHLSDLLTTISVVFGFALAALLFYIQAAGVWAEDKRVESIANKLVDWHTWTLLCLLGLMGYIVLLWAFERYFINTVRYSLFAFLVFLVCYVGCQILNHTLTIWWVFKRRKHLTEGNKR